MSFEATCHRQDSGGQNSTEVNHSKSKFKSHFGSLGFRLNPKNTSHKLIHKGSIHVYLKAIQKRSSQRILIDCYGTISSIILEDDGLRNLLPPLQQS